jgi:DNA processing protein
MAWSRLTEPEHHGAADLVRGLGAEAALHHLLEGRVDWGQRLAPRLELLDIDREVALLRRIGARVLVPGDGEWPSGVDDLAEPPHCLWVRGPLHLGDACGRSVSIVGARSATVYGTTTAADLAAGLCERDFTVVSGAAFGIDAAAHRGALSVEGATVAVLAGGVERPYPAAHEHLLSQIAEAGLVVSEVPPGSAPTRHRFLSRNRLIATATQGTVVVEAGLRSGSLSTANQALQHHRVLAAVPGPVTSMVSAGCHQYIRDKGAVLVTDAAEAAEAVGSIGRDLAPEKRGPERAEDSLDAAEDRVLGSLAVRKPVGVRTLAVQTTMGERELVACLGRLEIRGLAVRDGDGWRKRPSLRSAGSA